MENELKQINKNELTEDYKTLRQLLLKYNWKIFKYFDNGILTNFKSYNNYEIEQIQKEFDNLTENKNIIHFEFYPNPYYTFSKLVLIQILY